MLRLILPVMLLLVGCSSEKKEPVQNDAEKKHFMQSEVDALQQAREIKALADKKRAESDQAAEQISK